MKFCDSSQYKSPFTFKIEVLSWSFTLDRFQALVIKLLPKRLLQKCPETGWPCAAAAFTSVDSYSLLRAWPSPIWQVWQLPKNGKFCTDNFHSAHKCAKSNYKSQKLKRLCKEAWSTDILAKPRYLLLVSDVLSQILTVLHCGIWWAMEPKDNRFNKDDHIRSYDGQ